MPLEFSTSLPGRVDPDGSAVSVGEALVRGNNASQAVAKLAVKVNQLATELARAQGIASAHQTTLQNLASTAADLTSAVGSLGEVDKALAASLANLTERVQALETTPPALVTYADLLAMFPERLRPAQRAVVETGLPTLNLQMRLAGIVNPRRVAAFLATLQAESMFEYNIHQFNDTRLYAGRGYIQLTGSLNYEAAGKYLGVDLLNDPSLALSLQWSAKIATWYWTKARPKCNEFADTLQMGKVNAAIGFPIGDGSSDRARCAAFAAALRYLTGEIPAGITCVR